MESGFLRSIALSGHNIFPDTEILFIRKYTAFRFVHIYNDEPAGWDDCLRHCPTLAAVPAVRKLPSVQIYITIVSVIKLNIVRMISVLILLSPEIRGAHLIYVNQFRRIFSHQKRIKKIRQHKKC